MHSKFITTILIGLSLLLAFVLIHNLALATEYNLDDLIEIYAYDPGQPLLATEELVESTFFHDQYSITFLSVHGQTIPGNLIIPRESWAGSGPYPAILFMHGHSGSSAIYGPLQDLLNYTEYRDRPYVILAIDAEYHGERSVPGRDMILLNFIQDRGAMATTVIDQRRALDYLQARPEVIPDELHLMGVSMGAMLAALTAAVDHRVDAVSLITGGGDWTELFRTAQMGPAVLMRMALNNHFNIIPRYMDPIDPVVLIPNASPDVAVQMHNGLLDVVVPTGQLLYDAAGEPKQIFWYMANHNTMGPFMGVIFRRALNWFDQY